MPPNILSSIASRGPLKILFVTAEMTPFMKVGGLGEVMFSLPRALRKLGHDARVFIPRYAEIDSQKWKLDMTREGLEVPTGKNQDVAICNVKQYSGQDAPPTYFLENMEYYEKRANVYGYSDDAVRWALLSRGALEFIRKSDWTPHCIVATDWQVGFVPNYIHQDYASDPVLSKIATVFSIHNLFYQGMFDHRFVSEMDYDAGQAAIPNFSDPRLLKINAMRRGIMYADVINTVSPSYAQEIMTPDYGEGLYELLRERRTRLFGILNGIDYERHNPETDTYLKKTFGAKTAEARAENKLELQRQFGLTQNPAAFLAAMVSRLDPQKGFDILEEAFAPMMQNVDLQMVILGGGDNRYRMFFEAMAKKFPKRVGGHFTFDPVLPHLIFGGADAILIPSKFEPCGLTQMEAMRYGCIPIARKTGGLTDTVNNFDCEKRTGNGFVFENYDQWALFAAVIRASECHRMPNIWNAIIKNAMQSDFSWERSAKEYERIFRLATKFHGEKLQEG